MAPRILELWCGCTDITSAKNVDNCKAPEPAPVQDENLSAAGPLVPAAGYKGDPDDPIDSKLAWHLAAFEPAVISGVKLCRLQPGEYRIDGRRVQLYFAEKTLYHSGHDELLVHEHGMGTSDTPLPTYLLQVVNIAASLQGRTAGAPAVARIPSDKRLTFAPAPCVAADTSNQRVREMRMACEQARLRENAAEAYEAAVQMPPSKLAQIHVVPALSPPRMALPTLRANSYGTLVGPSGRPPTPVGGRPSVSYPGPAYVRASSHGALPTGARARAVPPPSPTMGSASRGRPTLEAAVRTIAVSPVQINLVTHVNQEVLSRRASPTRVPPNVLQPYASYVATAPPRPPPRP